MPKVSIVMPTYNVEKYFRQCIESVINQTLEDIEIIPVDDGSPDNCGKIMDEYAKNDSRIKPIHKENGGYGSAVNIGIEKATGEYIAILETDDWVEPNMYELLYNNAKENDADIVKCGFYYYNSYNSIKDLKNDMFNIISSSPSKSFNIKEYPDLMIYHASIWSGMYRGSFLKTIKLLEKEYYQDFPFIIEALCKAEKIFILKEYLVHYRLEENQNSSTNRKDKKLLYMPINTLNALNILKKYNLFEELKEYFYFHAFLANYSFYKNIKLKYKKKYTILLKEIFNEIKDDPNFKFTYFPKNEKEFLLKILTNSTFSIMLGWYLKSIKNFFIYKYDYKIYRVIVILGFIKITIKSTRLEIKERIDKLENLILSLKDQIEKNTESTKNNRKS